MNLKIKKKKLQLSNKQRIFRIDLFLIPTSERGNFFLFVKYASWNNVLFSNIYLVFFGYDIKMKKDLKKVYLKIQADMSILF